MHIDIVGKGVFCKFSEFADVNMSSVLDEALNFYAVTCRWQRRALSTVQVQMNQMWQNVSFAW